MTPLPQLAGCLLQLLLLSPVNAVSTPHREGPPELPGPYKIFKTEPDFVPSAIKVIDKTKERDKLEPGYYFIAPHIGMTGFGPQIIDQDANLVWYGWHKTRGAYAGDFYVCDFKGQKKNHLCWGENRGANHILNNHYEYAVKPFRDMGPLGLPDVHEFNVVDGGNSFLTVFNKKRKMDLRPYKGHKEGFVTDGCFLEIDIRKRKVLFRWCFLDHYEVHETFLYLRIPANKVNSSSSTSGRGEFMNPWDFMHINAVDKNEEGDYLVSGRHLSQLIKVAGNHNRLGIKPGKTVWRLNGRHSDFKMQEKAKFGRQHHCRFRHTGRNETILSVFNNAFDGVLKATRPESQGLILRVNNQTMDARVEKIYKHPKGHRSYAQGSFDILPQTKNVVIGWGTYPEMSEMSENGTLLFHAEAHIKGQGKLTQYRVFKSAWVGRPKTKPKVVVYCRTCYPFWKRPPDVEKAPIMAYVSWNGATEVKSWRFHLAVDKRKGPWFLAGEFEKKGFETTADLTSAPDLKSTAGMAALGKVATFAPWVSVDALNVNGTVLANVVTKIFVPKRSFARNCGIHACKNGERFDYNRSHSRAGSCDIDWVGDTLLVVLIALFIESVDVYLNGFARRLVEAQQLRDFSPI